MNKCLSLVHLITKLRDKDHRGAQVSTAGGFECHSHARTDTLQSESPMGTRSTPFRASFGAIHEVAGLTADSQPVPNFLSGKSSGFELFKPRASPGIFGATARPLLTW
jgi:hypothetical protein